jgi:group I intron endonuclease
MYGIIYVVTNTVNGKQYVGQTTLMLKDRWRLHLKSALKYFLLGVLYNAIRKYGVEAFTIEQIDVAVSQDKLNEKEIHHVARLGTYGGGYNLTPGGGQTKFSGETRRKLSEIALGRVNSEETRRKMSEAHLGKLKPFCKRGHSLDIVNTFIGFSGHRSCRTCCYLRMGRKLPQYLRVYEEKAVQ